MIALLLLLIACILWPPLLIGVALVALPFVLNAAARAWWRGFMS